MKRELVFKMERPGLVAEGDSCEVSEGRLPSAWYYTIEPAVAMSYNVPLNQRLKVNTGVITKVEHKATGYYVTAEFEE
ncbi:MAG: hypothetical protein K6C69_04925 [Lachnospiraceae bacterium]|nr:hypothetical protein [Lachnospiraceae bacterium]